MAIQVVQNLVRFGGNLILTRLVTPDAFGLIGAALSVTYIAFMISEVGFSAYVLKRPQVDKAFLDFVWTARLVRDIGLAAVLFLVSGLAAHAFGYPQLTGILQVLAATTLLGAFTSLGPIMAQRDGLQIRLGLVELAVFVVQTIVILIAAYFLRSYWAILCGSAVAAVLTLLASYAAYPAPARRWHVARGEVSDLWTFAKLIIPANLIRILLSQTDKLVLIKFLSLSDFGKYTIASSLSTVAVLFFQHYINRVFTPSFNRVNRESPQTAPSYFYVWRRRVTMLMVFVVAGVAGAAHFIVELLFSPEYAGAEFFLRFASLGALAFASTAPAEQALLARGDTSVFLRGNAGRLLWLAIACPIGFYLGGPRGVFLAVCVVETAAVPVLWGLLKRAGLLNVRQELLIFSPAIAGFALGLAADAVATFLQSAGYLPDF